MRFHWTVRRPGTTILAEWYRNVAGEARTVTFSGWNLLANVYQFVASDMVGVCCSFGQSRSPLFLVCHLLRKEITLVFHGTCCLDLNPDGLRAKFLSWVYGSGNVVRVVLPSAEHAFCFRGLCRSFAGETVVIRPSLAALPTASQRLGSGSAVLCYWAESNGDEYDRGVQLFRQLAETRCDVNFVVAVDGRISRQRRREFRFSPANCHIIYLDGGRGLSWLLKHTKAYFDFAEDLDCGLLELIQCSGLTCFCLDEGVLPEIASAQCILVKKTELQNMRQLSCIVLQNI